MKIKITSVHLYRLKHQAHLHPQAATQVVRDQVVIRVEEWCVIRYRLKIP